MSSSSIRLGCCRGVCVVALLWAASTAHAQGTPGRTVRADPLDAQARVPAVTHTSPLAGYRRLGDDKRISWQEANETVTRIGGWRAYAREAQQPQPPASAPSTAPAAGCAPKPPASPAPAHGGHQKH